MSFRYVIETENPIVTDGNKMFNCNDGKLRLRIVEDGHWQTGTPTIEEIDKDNQYCYALCFYYDGWWLSDYLFKANHDEGCFENSPNNGQKVCKVKFNDDIAWQRIEPYKGDGE